MSEESKVDEQKKHEHIVAEHQLETHEVNEVLNFFRTYGKTILIAAVAAAAVFMSANIIKAQKLGKEAEADLLLARAAGIEALTSVIETYPGTQAAAVALAAAAQTAFNQGDYPRARSLYEQLNTTDAAAELKEVASLGLNYCLEAEGNFEAAAEGFGHTASLNPSSFVYPLAVFGQGRCLEQLGRYDEAQMLYEDFAVANEQSTWAMQAMALAGRMAEKTR